MSNAQQVTYDDIDQVKTLIEHQLRRYMTKNDIVADLSENHNIEPKLTEIVWEQLETENEDFFRAYHLRLATIPQINRFNELLEQQGKLMSDNNSESTRIPTPSGPQSSSMAPLGPGPSMNSQQANLTMPDSVGASFVQALMQQGSSNAGGHSVMTDVLIPNIDPRLGLMHPTATFSEMRAPFPETSGTMLNLFPAGQLQNEAEPVCARANFVPDRDESQSLSSTWLTLVPGGGGQSESMQQPDVQPVPGGSRSPSRELLIFFPGGPSNMQRSDVQLMLNVYYFIPQDNALLNNNLDTRFLQNYLNMRGNLQQSSSYVQSIVLDSNSVNDGSDAGMMQRPLNMGGQAGTSLMPQNFVLANSSSNAGMMPSPLNMRGYYMPQDTVLEHNSLSARMMQGVNSGIMPVPHVVISPQVRFGGSNTNNIGLQLPHPNAFGPNVNSSNLRADLSASNESYSGSLFLGTDTNSQARVQQQGAFLTLGQPAATQTMPNTGEFIVQRWRPDVGGPSDVVKRNNSFNATTEHGTNTSQYISGANIADSGSPILRASDANTQPGVQHQGGANCGSGEIIDVPSDDNDGDNGSK